MRYTLLDLVQRILESMESDEVSSINETPESLSVANIVKECYFDIVGKLNPAESRGVFKFDASTDNTKPALMYVPSNVSRIEWVKYMNLNPSDSQGWKYIRFMNNEEFIYYQESFNINDPNVGSMVVTINSKPWTFYYHTDRAPEYYTVFDEGTLLFNAYDSAYENTLSESNSMGYGELVPVFLMEDTFIPDLDPRQFQLLLQDAKSTAHVELKQAPNPKAEAKARAAQVRAQKTRNDNNPYASVQPHYRYGRKGPGQRREVMVQAMRRGR